MSEHITTYTKRHVWPLDPSAEQICERDIAHALSLMVRANGHFPEFYSVGQHCIACCLEARARGYGRRLELACLLHDASEAYMADITRPVKAQMSAYREAEERLLAVIFEKYLGSGLSAEEKRRVKLVDDALLSHEFWHYMGERIQAEEPELLSTPKFETQPFGQVEEEYLRLFCELIKG